MILVGPPLTTPLVAEAPRPRHLALDFRLHAPPLCAVAIGFRAKALDLRLCAFDGVVRTAQRPVAPAENRPGAGKLQVGKTLLALVKATLTGIERALTRVGKLLALIGKSLAFVSDAVTFIRDQFTLIGNTVALISATGPLVELTPELFGRARADLP